MSVTHKQDCVRVKAIRERLKVLPDCNCGGEQEAEYHAKAQAKINKALRALNLNMKAYRLRTE